ncbi:MAG TPA: tRNA lysidine(34) synthetase TilS [Clostridiales bacterium]|nr:tRNA lysidine(34) synthetase TilS [Clostridiales bacterium]
MTEKVLRFIKDNMLLKSGDSVIVAVSGGADSIALLHLLKQNEKRLGIEVSAAHVNHGIRGDEAKRDENFVIEFCEKRSIPLKVFHEDIPSLAKKLKIGEEECGRKRRYELLCGIDDFSLIATAHNLNDNLETVLLNLTRGTALTGLCGIPVKRGRIIRPLLNCTREEIEAYCKENSLEYVTDSTNDDAKYSRNKIRKFVIPKLQDINPSILENFAEFLENIKRDEVYLNEQAQRLLSEAVENGKFKSEAFKKAHPAVRYRAIKAVISNYISGGIEKRHIEKADELLSKCGSFDLCETHRVTSDGKYLFVEEKASLKSAKPPEPIAITKTDITEKETEFKFADFIITLRLISKTEIDSLQKINNEVCYNLLDYDKMTSAIVIRGRKSGDRLRIKERGLSKTLKKLYSENKLPQSLREINPIIADDEGVVFVNGFGADERCAADNNSKKIILVSVRRK